MHTQWIDALYQYRIGIEWTESSFAEKNQGVLWDTQLYIRQQCTLGSNQGQLHPGIS